MNEIKKGPFFGYGRDLPTGFVKQFVSGKYNSPAVIDAVLKYLTGACFVGSLTESDMHGEDVIYVAEYPLSADSAVLATYRLSSGDVSAVIAQKDSTGTPAFTQFSVSKTSRDARAIILAMIPVFAEMDDYKDSNKQFRNILDFFAGALGKGIDTLNTELQEAATDATAHIFERITALTDEVPVIMPPTGNFFVDDEIINENEVTKVIVGTPMFFTLADGVSVGTTAPVKVAVKEENKNFPGSFKLSETPDEYKHLVPELPPYFVVTKEITTVLKHIVQTSDDMEPMRNFLFRGPSGTGKTAASRAIAVGLDKPYVSVTCSANTEMVDLLGQLLPNVSAAGGEDNVTLGDIMYAPEEVYKTLTGEDKDDATPEEVFELLRTVSKPGSQYTYQESDFVRAIRNGWVVEIQEAAAITNPAVLTGLNKILNIAEMDAEGLLLPDNTRLKRHPEAVVILTTNVNYEGCRPLNESVVDRMNLIYDMENPPKIELKKRVMKRTGYTDEATLDKMLKVVDMIDEQLKSCGIKGTCGPRAVYDWVRSVMITGDPYASGVLAVVNKAATDPDERDIIEKCLQSQFTPKGMKE